MHNKLSILKLFLFVVKRFQLIKFYTFSLLYEYFFNKKKVTNKFLFLKHNFKLNFYFEAEYIVGINKDSL